ncbi:MAG: Gfo/Idh/MocA family oxidoreductase [Verrucomicrobia bacterium]|nr:Gfo/Idh/MocA family oxidoreductase [Verrucomicrobiota bacterium]
MNLAAPLVRTPSAAGLTRRDFLSTSARLGAVITAAPQLARAAVSSPDTLNVAIVGCGAQGLVLMNAVLLIPGLRLKAFCDLWPQRRQRAVGLARKYGHEANGFADYRELLAGTEHLDAVIVATPDFRHAEHTNAALRAGCHVYCEKLMSNTVEGARSMVLTARATGKLLQIGHQRRSNPCYLHARDRLLREAHLLGRITSASGEWHRRASDDIAAAPGSEVPPDVLERHGFASMHELLNWRWYRRFAGGPISDLGAHQIDMFNWMLDAQPRALVASGGTDYYRQHEWYDNAVAVYEYPTPQGLVRATYDVLTTTSAGGGYHEYFMGDQGALKISENPSFTKVYREPNAPDWEPLLERQLLRNVGDDGTSELKPWEKPRRRLLNTLAARPKAPRDPTVVDIRDSLPGSVYELPVTTTAIHQPHLENFFAAIRHGTPLACPGESAFATAVTVLRVNEAIAAERKLTFAPGDFVV